jgi:hypothetical protein
MKQYIRTCVVAAAIALVVSGVARANDNDDDGKPCSDAMLRGLYVFSASGFNIVAGVAQPKALVELIRFDGEGNLTAPMVTVSINGTIVRSSGTPGIYTVGPDCTGTLKFLDALAPTYDLFVVFKGSEIHLIQTGQNFNGLPVIQGTAQWVLR